MKEHNNVKEFPRTFVPTEADLGDWDAIEPLFEELVGRSIGSSGFSIAASCRPASPKSARVATST